MRLGWTTSKYSTTYRAVKTVRIDGKNKTLIVKSFGSEKYICETYGVSDAKAWAKEQVRLMNQAEKEDAAKFTIELCAGTDLSMDDQRRFNGGYLFLQDIYYELGLDKICRAISPSLLRNKSAQTPSASQMKTALKSNSFVSFGLSARMSGFRKSFRKPQRPKG
ncbi:hypothetical protein AALB53_03435 [Lachnospiraceae bacterium 47-T17]